MFEITLACNITNKTEKEKNGCFFVAIIPIVFQNEPFVILKTTMVNADR